jgi:hypothetical protein
MANEPTANPGREADDAKCACKKAPAAVQKSAAQHRDPNSLHDGRGGQPEPTVPRGRKLDFANVTAVPADSPAATIRNGAEALSAHRRFLEAQAAGTASGSGGTGGNGGGSQLGVTYRTGGGLPASLAAVDAGRCQLQGNGLGRLGGGK